MQSPPSSTPITSTKVTVQRVIDSLPDIITQQETHCVVLISVNDEGIHIFNKGISDANMLNLLKAVIDDKSNIVDEGFVLDKDALIKLQ